MKEEPITMAVDYYQKIGAKNSEGVKKYLHPNVLFYGPLASLSGHQAVIQAIENFMHAIESLTICAKFGSENQAMVVYEVNFPGIAPDFPGAALLDFQEGLIARIQLFYDGSRMSAKKEEIFSN
ncbi:MAG: nuclear transport factor 2 family protein [Parachlamydia sp.]|jgi:hypothetical protein|nr:nuclear transport factor 2 family protein [Parachlamydia sp.]